MKKVYFGVFKFKNIIINACIILLLGIITAVAFIGGNESLITSTTNGAYYHGNRSNNCVSLMVNVYWGTEYIEDMLEVFEQKQVKTTFFLGGIWVLENEELVNKIVKGKMNDGQLDECPITVKQLSKIKSSFVFTMLNMLHSRVEYQKSK